MRGKLIEGIYFPDRNRRSYVIPEVLDSYLAQEKPRRAPVPYCDLERRCKDIKAFFGSKRLEEIKPSDVQNYRNYLAQRMGLLAVNRNHGQLRRIFNWAQDAGMFHGENPASSRKVKMPSERKHWRRDFMSEVDVKKLLHYAHPTIKPIIIAAVLTGMRRQEIMKMRKKDVDLDRCIIYIPDSKTGEPGFIPISETLLKVLEPLVKVAPSPDSLVFDWTCWFERWEQARRDSGLERFVFHHLRHTAASWLAIRTGNLFIVQNFLRHKTLAMTSRYAHLASSELRKAVLKLDDTELLEEGTQEAKVPVLPALPITQTITFADS